MTQAQSMELRFGGRGVLGRLRELKAKQSGNVFLRLVELKTLGDTHELALEDDNEDVLKAAHGLSPSAGGGSDLVRRRSAIRR